MRKRLGWLGESEKVLPSNLPSQGIGLREFASLCIFVNWNPWMKIERSVFQIRILSLIYSYETITV